MNLDRMLSPARLDGLGSGSAENSRLNSIATTQFVSYPALRSQQRGSDVETEFDYTHEQTSARESSAVDESLSRIGEGERQLRLERNAASAKRARQKKKLVEEGAENLQSFVRPWIWTAKN